MPDERDWHNDTAVTYGEMVLRHDREISEIRLFVTRAEAVIALARWVLGASLLSGVLSIITLAQILTGKP